MKRGLIYGAIIAGLFVLYGILRHRDAKIDAIIAAPTLGPDDRLKYVIDPRTHTITTVTRDQGNGERVTRTFLNPHGPVAITEKNGGAVILTQRTYGTIHEPNIGAAIGVDLKPRVAVGVNLVYAQRWELGGGLMLTPSEIKDVRAYGAVSYNVYSNCLLSVGLDNHKTIQFVVGLRF